MARIVPMLLIAGVIAYGSLYPFAFHQDGSLAEDIAHLAGTWNQPPQSRGDLLANLILYMPFGFAAAQVFVPGGVKVRAAIFGFLLGALLALALELTQFYDHGRFSALSDVYLNAAGAALGGAFAATQASRRLRLSLPSDGPAIFARILLLAWLGWRLFPYVPTIDLHKYWYSIQLLRHVPADMLYGVWRETILWLSVIVLAHAGFAVKNFFRFLAPAILFFFAAKIVIIGQYIGLPEAVGAALALILYLMLRHRSPIVLIPMAALFAVVVVQTRILPLQWAPEPKLFQWIPFFGFLHGSMQLNIIAFWQKLYLYGALLWLSVRAGMRLDAAMALECAILLATSMLQIFLIGRSAEITDAVMALILGVVYWGLRGWFPARAPA